MTTKALLTMGFSTRLVTGLIPGLGDHKLFFSFGREVPDLAGLDVSYWMGGMWAARLQQVGLARHLCSPGPAWLPGLDPALTGRTIQHGVLKNIADDDEVLWVKPAEAKVPAFPAGAYSGAALRALYAASEIPAHLHLQWTSSILSLDFEHRFFVVDGKIVTGSPYRVVDTALATAGRWSRYEAALAFATHALLMMEDEAPPHFTLDVALNVTTGRWLIVEGNRSWSSGIYGCDPVLALMSIEAACHDVPARWLWQTEFPQALLDEAPIAVLPLNVASNGYMEFDGRVT